MNEVHDITVILTVSLFIHLLYKELCQTLKVAEKAFHVSGRNYEYTFRLETPTLLAICSSSAFFTWRRALNLSGIDLTRFVQEEMTTSVLRALGWLSSAPMELFSLDFQPYETVNSG